jgi:hypothetical protein
LTVCTESNLVILYSWEGTIDTDVLFQGVYTGKPGF